MKTGIIRTMVAVVFLVSFVYFVGVLRTNIHESFDNEGYKYKKHIGEKFIIDKDTLTIVDYSMWEENFTLSDGRKVSYVLIGDKETK